MKSATPWALIIALSTLQAWASDTLEELSLEELVNTEITSVSRKTQNLADVPAAAFVISSEDIRRSGALALPDVLRMVPGLQVAQIDSGRYAVSARGFNGRFANKLQVLIDGRSIYNPIFSGVIWEQDQIALEDIERIEVIRGPGAAMWGANAVNGVINIISKHSRNQQGRAVSFGVGTAGTASLYAREGGTLESGSTYKISYQGRHAEPSRAHRPDQSSHDRLNNSLLDARLDHNLDNGRDLTLWASVSRSDLGDLYSYPKISRTPPFFGTGSSQYAIEQLFHTENLMGRYRWLSASGIESSLQAALTHSGIDLENLFEEHRTTYDLEYQGRYPLGTHDLLWGLTHRSSNDRITTNPRYSSFNSPKDSQHASGIFIQDDWTLIQEYLRLGLGARIDQSERTGKTVSPNVTLMWTPGRSDTLWAKYARAPRIPSRAEQDVNIYSGIYQYGPIPILLHTQANKTGLTEERLEGLDIGYRKQFSPNFNIDLAGFRYHYRNLRTGKAANALPHLSNFPPLYAMEIDICGCLSGWVSGTELNADWLVMPAWRLQLSVTLLRMSMDSSSDPMVHTDSQNTDKGEPRKYASLRSQWNISGKQQFDAWLRASSGYYRLNVPYTDLIRINGYVTLDLRYSHKLSDSTEIFVSGRNLLGSRRLEFIPDYLPAATSDVRPSLYVGARLKF